MIPSDITKDIHDNLNEMSEDCRKRGDHYYELAKNEKSSETKILGIVYTRL